MKNLEGKKCCSWLLLLFSDAGTAKESAIRSMHQVISETSSQHLSNCFEITTVFGKSQVYEKFKCRKCKHPILLILNKPPLDYAGGDLYVVIELGG